VTGGSGAAARDGARRVVRGGGGVACWRGFRGRRCRWLVAMAVEVRFECWRMGYFGQCWWASLPCLRFPVPCAGLLGGDSRWVVGRSSGAGHGGWGGSRVSGGGWCGFDGMLARFSDRSPGLAGGWRWGGDLSQVWWMVGRIDGRCLEGRHHLISSVFGFPFGWEGSRYVDGVLEKVAMFLALLYCTSPGCWLPCLIEPETSINCQQHARSGNPTSHHW
jgi:hypothetical protein